ncbi:Tetratricopeptide repeat (TPR)-like superfamily protein [Zea mays]|uniref:Tetratricopeptide repeat (TPR)-like superfamily protein n=1 Tax=Zea mays TaxID=4577 RepID=A0A1D6DWX4_MAIZE|nr:Tetratricopeptide repeat (TPR)-like superfamily protein [Zea mays]
MAALDAGLPAEAVRHFTKILEARRGVLPHPFAAAFQAGGRPADAIADCNRSLALDPAYIPALRARADLLQSVGAVADCLRDLDLKLLQGGVRMPSGLRLLTKIEALPRISKKDAEKMQLQRMHKLEHLALRCNTNEEQNDKNKIPEINSGDFDLDALAEALEQSATLASNSKKKNKSKHANAPVKRPVLKAQACDLSIPVLSCFTYIMIIDKGTVGSNISELVLDKETMDAANDGEEKWEGEKYEYHKAIGADRTFSKFEKRLLDKIEYEHIIEEFI